MAISSDGQVLTFPTDSGGEVCVTGGLYDSDSTVNETSLDSGIKHVECGT